MWKQEVSFIVEEWLEEKKKKGDYEEGISVQSNDYMGEGSGGEKEEEART